MKAYEVRKFGLDGIALTERPQPQPGPGQVLLRMKAWSLNYRDLMVAKGTYNPRQRLPLVPLSDGVGEVAALGAGVTRVKVGERVAGIFMQTWLDGPISEAKAKSSLGAQREGVLAEYALLDGDGVVPVPEHLSDDEAASLPCAAVTAWHALFHEGGPRPGTSVLIQGTGGVSLFALQFARMAGARVIATSSSDAKLERVRGMGASDGINYKTTPDWGECVRQLTGEGVDHIIEVGGAGTLGQSLRGVRMGGRISLIGVLAGGGEVNPMPILMKNVRVQGIYVGSRAMFEAMNQAIALQGMRPVVDRVFPFAEAVEAYRYLESGQHFGKVCIRLA
jgi:NADPH:quinone reductase-like Zn-dependent oxidoreductase